MPALRACRSLCSSLEGGARAPDCSLMMKFWIILKHSVEDNANNSVNEHIIMSAKQWI